MSAPVVVAGPWPETFGRFGHSVRDDALFQDTNEQNWNWTGIWQGKAAINDEGWAAEIRAKFFAESYNDCFSLEFAPPSPPSTLILYVGWALLRVENSSRAGVADLQFRI